MTHGIIKQAFIDPRIIEGLPLEAFEPMETKILLTLKRQAQLIEKPSMKSVLNDMGLNPQEKEGVKPLLKSIAEAPTLDKAEIELALFGLRTRAQMNIARLISALGHEATDRDVHPLITRMHELMNQKEDQFREPINAKQWQLLEKLEMEEIRLNIDCFDDNDITIKKKVLYGFIATTNGGKTIIKTWMATKLIRVGQNILYLALEEPAEDTIRRVHQACLGITETQYRELTRDGFEAVGEQFNEKSEEKGWGEFVVVEWPNIKIDDMKRRIQEYEKETGIKFDGVVVDYGKLITTSQKSTQEWERIGLVFKELKTFCMEMNVYCITSIQLNREATKNFLKDGQTPDLYDVAGAYEATTHLNYIWSVQLTPNEAPNKNFEDPNEKQGQFTLIVQKQKYGKLQKGSRLYFSWTMDHNLVETRIAPDVGDSLEEIIGYDETE